MFGRDLPVADDMMGDEFLDIFGALHREVVAHARGDTAVRRSAV
jgi:hypothetical protein